MSVPTLADYVGAVLAGASPGLGGLGPDLGGLSASAWSDVTVRAHDGSLGAFAAAGTRVGFCSRPVRLVGSSTAVDGATGEVLGEFSSADAPLGVLYRPCGNRRADACPACSRVYARDTFEMIRSGVQGGKTVPGSVARNPLLFVTLTAPSFGHVHGTRSGGRCRPRSKATRCAHGRPTWCMAKHTDTDPVVGAPICSECYDWSAAVVWQWHAPELWRRATIAVRRHLAAGLGVRESRLRDVAAVQFAKVAEFQARGLVHFHALVRLDGPDGPGSSAPVSGDVFAAVVGAAVRSATVVAPPVDREDVPRVLAFGAQLDVRVVRTGSMADAEDLGAEQVAGYLAKYSTKSTGVDPAAPRPHLARLGREVRYLADRAATACRPEGRSPEEDQDADDGGCVCRQCKDSPYRLLGKWVRMLGFRGHFSTKSRRFSVTLGKLRRARQRFQAMAAEAARTGVPMDTRDLEARLLADDDETTLVVGSWSFRGCGWETDGDTELALAAAARAREYARERAAERRAEDA